MNHVRKQQVIFGLSFLWAGVILSALQWQPPATSHAAVESAPGSPAHSPGAVQAVTRTVTGSVVYQPRGFGAAPSGIPNVDVTLLGSDGLSETVVVSGSTAPDGSFSLLSSDAYTLHRLAMTAGSLPKGYSPMTATAPAPADVLDALSIDYGLSGAGTYGFNRFVLGDAKPGTGDAHNGDYFLVVATNSLINAGALSEFVDFKRRLGFQVETISVETIDANFAGPDRRARIHALELVRRQTYGGRFKYVLLVGTDSVIPFTRLTVSFNGYNGNANPAKDPTACLDPKAKKIGFKYSDWYYVDLNSNWDSNGNGCLGDGAWADPATFASGYTPDAGLQWQPTVSVGRLPFDSAASVMAALKDSMHFEQQSEGYKLRTLLGMSMDASWGYYWYTPSMQYKQCGGAQWSIRCQKPNNGTSYDLAYLAEAMKTDFLNGDGLTSYIYYENQNPVTSAGPFASPIVISEQALAAELALRYHGMVNLGGHGNSSGTYRVYWVDANGNGRPDQPTNPADTPGNASVKEIKTANEFTTSALTPTFAYGGRSAIWIAAACLTGSPEDLNSLGARLLAEGYGVGWVGGLSVVTFAGWKQPGDGTAFSSDYYITRNLLHNELRLGDAVWKALAQRIADGSHASSEITFDLYGDPTLSYWGNPGGQSTLAAWPMLRHEPFGQGRTTLVGPGVPVRDWTYTATTTFADPLPRSPVVSNNGEVIVSYGPYVDVLRKGVLYQRLQLDATSFGTPALAADGTIYVVDVNGKLYAFAYNTSPISGLTLDSVESPQKAGPPNNKPERHRRWALQVGSPPRTSPVVGSDGFIALAYGSVNNLVALIRPDGALFRQGLISGEAIGELAIGADRMIYATTNSTSNSDIYRLDFFCASAVPCESISYLTSFSQPNSTPPLLAYGSVYYGRADGQIYKRAMDTLLTQATFTADSAVTAGPIAGPGNQILVGTQNGTLYSLTKNLGVRWQKNIGGAIRGMPAYSADALYVVTNDRLKAYDPNTGAQLWSHLLSNGAGNGSVAVGYGREVFAQTGNGTVAAVGEGWTYAPFVVAADTVQISRRVGLVRGFEVQWLLDPLPPDCPVCSAASGAPVMPANVAGFKIQRSDDGADWIDIATVPSTTLSYSDTSVLDNTYYAYRVQTLDSGGNDSDFTGTPGSQPSLPALPQAPTLISVTALAADALHLEWSSPADDVVGHFQIERALSASGPFTLVAQTLGGAGGSDDAGLTAATTYFYRIQALNDTGASPYSNVLSGTTHALTLSTPQNVSAKLLSNGQIQVSWTAGPVGVGTLVEVIEVGVQDYQLLGTTDNAGPFAHYPNEPSGFSYRVKFVQGNAESAYGYTDLGVDTRVVSVYLPLIVK